MEKKPKEPKTPLTGFASINEDLVQNILKRTPATSFASAACVSKSWNHNCNQILSKPKLASAFSLNPDPKVCWALKKKKKKKTPILHGKVSNVNCAFVCFDGDQTGCITRGCE
jgi:hypothetical protein